MQRMYLSLSLTFCLVVLLLSLWLISIAAAIVVNDVVIVMIVDNVFIVANYHC